MFLSVSETGVMVMILDTKDVLVVSFMFVSLKHLGGHFIYNSYLLMNFPIQGAALITASCKHDLSSLLVLA